MYCILVLIRGWIHLVCSKKIQEYLSCDPINLCGSDNSFKITFYDEVELVQNMQKLSDKQ